jgi:hypothetical protein
MENGSIRDSSVGWLGVQLQKEGHSRTLLLLRLRVRRVEREGRMGLSSMLL